MAVNRVLLAISIIPPSFTLGLQFKSTLWGTTCGADRTPCSPPRSLNSVLDTEYEATNPSTTRPLPFLHEEDIRGSSFYRIRYSSGTKCDGVENFHTNPWRSLVPPMRPPLLKVQTQAHVREVDVTIEWSMEDDTSQVAKWLVEQCIQDIPKTGTCDFSSLREARTTQRLSWSLSSFRTFVFQELLLSSLRKSGGPLRFKARMSVSRGPAGTFCPKWHVDHVPVRWIESFVGRGTEFVAASNGGVQWVELDDEIAVHENSVNIRKRLVVDSVDSKLAKLHRAAEGEAMLLKGNRWNEFARHDQALLEPAVHKSPSPIPFWKEEYFWFKI
jgi:hypothetical protein